MVCERLPAMQEQTRLVKFLVQNSLSAPTQVFEECGATYSPPPFQNLVRTWDFRFEFVLPPSPQQTQKFGQIEGLWILVGPEYTPPPPQ